MRVAFIAVNYNNCRVSINYCTNIRALRGFNEKDVDIVIVDNASNMNDYMELAREIEDLDNVVLLRSEKNTGYFGGLNYGISHIAVDQYDYVIVGNNDLFFERDFLLKLREKQYAQKDTVIVPDVETIGGIHQNPQYISPPSKRRLLGMDVYYSCYAAALMVNLFWGFKRKQRRENRRNKTTDSMEIFLCTGALMILTPLFFKHCKMLDDSLFLWGEEAALAHQLEEAGDKMFYDSNLHVTHMENATVSRIGNRRNYNLHKQSYRQYRDYLRPNNYGE